MHFSGVYVLSEEPLVVSCLGHEDRARFIGMLPPCDILSFPSWQQRLRDVPKFYRDVLAAGRRGIRVHVMGASRDQDRVLRASGLRGALVSQNAYVNEHLFSPSETAKTFDAVYAAQMKPFKRLHLAAGVRSLFVVTYGDVVTESGEYDLHRFEPLLRHADFNRGWLSLEAIRDVYNRSRVGLALSAREGAMLAAVEYLLTGLPMVSTPSRGGRDEFFDDRFVRVVPPDRDAVARGVDEMVARNVDPLIVRRATLERLAVHRRALCEYVRAVVRARGANAPSADALHDRLFQGPSGMRRHFIHQRDFAARGWQQSDQ